MDETARLRNLDEDAETRITPLAPGAPPADTPQPGVGVPGFDLLDVLGRGGMGIVYKARQHGLNRVVALKMLLVSAHLDESDRLRFFAEAEVVAAVKHPNVVQVYEFGDADGHPYLAMEYVEGGSLSRLLTEYGALPVAEAARLVEQTARGVQAAHDQGIVHRDLKPGNILLAGVGNRETKSKQQEVQTRHEGAASPPVSAPTPLTLELTPEPPNLASLTPKVTDFGIAKRGGAIDLTLTGVAMGTPAYMSPEQARGQTKFVGPGADVYALGVILYECLTGKVPFDSGDSVELLQRVARDDPPRPRKFAPHVPKDLELICLKCLHKWPHERYPSAAALADDLARFLAGEPVSVRPPGRLERAAKWVRRYPARAALYGLTLLALLLGGIAAGAVSLWRDADEARGDAVTAKGKAEVAARRAEDAKAEAEAATDRALVMQRAFAIQQAAHDTDLAYREYLVGNVAQARRLLDGCPADYRPWEWRVVNRLCRRELLTIEPSNYPVKLPVVVPINGVAFVSDDSLLVAGPGMQQWDLAARKPTPVTKPSVVELSLSADGSRVATVGIQPGGVVYDRATWKPILNFPLCVYSALDGTGSKLLHGTRSSAALLDVNTKAVTPLSVEGIVPSSGVISRDGTKAALGGYRSTDKPSRTATGVVKVLPADGRGEPLLLVVNPLAPVQSVALDPTGSRFAAGCEDGTVVVCEIATQKMTRLTGHSGAVRCVAFDPTGKRLASGSTDRVVRVWSVDDATEQLTLAGHTSAVMSIAWSASGRRLASGGLEGTTRVWDVATAPDAVRLAVLKPDDLRMMVQERVLTISDDGTTLALCADTVVQAFNAKTGASLWPAAPVRREECVWLYADTAAKRLRGVTQSGGLCDWDLTTGAGGATNRRLPVKNIAAVSLDGSRAASPNQPPTRFTVHDLRTGAAVAVTGDHAMPILRAALSRDGRFVLVMGLDHKATVWNAVNGMKVCDLIGHVGGVLAGAFSPDGTRIVTCGPDGVVKLWEMPAGRELLTLRRTRYGAVAVGWSRDGSKLAVLDDLGVAHIWDAGGMGK